MDRGVFLALVAAVLFGASAPFARLLLRNASPQLLARLLYLGSSSTAPFVGAAFSLAMFRERPTTLFLAGAALMALGVWLHLTERHEHEHVHEAMEHQHLHVHDEHHRHAHRPEDPPGEPHSHRHRHEPLVHAHPPYPDIHHRHGHTGGASGA